MAVLLDLFVAFLQPIQLAFDDDFVVEELLGKDLTEFSKTL